MLDGTFPRKSPAGSADGPESNTGHNYPEPVQDQRPELCAPVIDWLSVTFPKGSLKKLGLHTFHDVLAHAFGVAKKIKLGPIEEKRWNFFPHSAVMVDETGTLCGRLGLSENGDFHFSFTGQGCGHIWNWHKVQAVLENTDARITRVDIAVDDLAGTAINIGVFEDLVRQGAFTSNGRPPLCNLIDDFDSGKGKTLYVGQRGYKQLCVYEKGKQLGDPTSDYTRAELRLYSKHHVITPDVLTNPGHFFAGAYEVLADFIGGEIQRLEAKERAAAPTAAATFEFLKRQAGTSFHLLLQAFGEDTLKVLVEHVAREGRPGRFKSFVGDPSTLLREHIRGRENVEGHYRVGEDGHPQRHQPEGEAVHHR